MIINFRSVEHCAPIIATVWRAMGSFGTQFGHHGEILQHFGLPTRWLGARPWEAVISAKMLYFLATMVELRSETSHSVSNDSTDGRAMLKISEIDDYGE